MKNILSPALRLICLFATGIGAAVLLGGCASDEQPDYQPLIFYEALPSTPSSMKADITLPVSGLKYSIIKLPQIPDQNFLATYIYEVGPPEARTPVLLVRLDAAAAKKLYHHTLVAKGTRLFLAVNGRFVGVHYIQDAIPNGDVFFYVELSNKDPNEFVEKLQKLKRDLNASILIIRKNRAKND